MSDAIPVVQLIDIPNHGQLPVIVQESPILLFRHDEDVFALDNVCTHTGDPLAGGNVDGFVVTCPWHGAKFDIRTGQNLCLPALCPTGTHKAWVENGGVFVKISEE